MQISFEDKNGIAVCMMKGDIDINTSPDVKKFFDYKSPETFHSDNVLSGSCNF